MSRYRRRKGGGGHLAVRALTVDPKRERSGIRCERNELDPAMLDTEQWLNLEQYRRNAGFHSR
ncbi:MAG TPA: hypothetical protein VGC52_02345 [Gemmatimonadaceae bacterium]|jgi:hypothetical protein